MKSTYQLALSRLLEDRPKSDTITFAHWARAEEIIEVETQEKVEHLSSHHIWTDAYAQSRLRWKPMLPLSILLLRVYRMEQPVSVPYIKEYGGCTSWVDIMPRVDLGRLEPALSDADFQRQVDAIKGSLGLALATG